jgi:phage portal protein BeeE
VRIEQRTNIEVYDGPHDGPLYSEFLVDGLLRGDITARYNAYAKAIQSGFMSPNDAARLENFTPVEGGDTRYIQMNMAKITDEGLAPLVPLAPREVP